MKPSLVTLLPYVLIFFEDVRDRFGSNLIAFDMSSFNCPHLTLHSEFPQPTFVLLHLLGTAPQLQQSSSEINYRNLDFICCRVLSGRAFAAGRKILQS